ncbi:LytR C-terminal domain-containing protein [Microbacterium elymi]|uniref:LytR C-terminal domain-containing protein n=1 Tax=Microbacterium elymi TaxID=2909587 RepID=A0ABY5NIL7_9MICO|nr:LytR C-terminal domain-containing protein [Microbacterium elymi]UUT35010.1 LytR C-terminal domain-containing protein [Microbacterium elymi]
MPRSTYPRDSFDDLPADAGRVGAHRAENPRLHAGAVIAWGAIATIVLIALGVFGTMLATGRLGPGATTAPTAAPTPSVTPVVDTGYSILILNATGVAGQATTAKNAVVHAGWAAGSVSPGEAGSTYPTTTVYYVLPEDAAAAAGLAEVVGGAAVVQSDKYQATGDPQAQR